MTFALELRDLDEMVHTKFDIGRGNEEQLKANKKAKALICKHLEDGILEGVLQMKFKTAWEIWYYLHQRYDIISRSEKGRTMQEFWESEQGNKTIQEYVTALQGKALNANSIGATIDDDDMINKLMHSLHGDFNSVIAQYDQKDYAKLGELVTALISEERRLSSAKPPSSNHSDTTHNIEALTARIRELESNAAGPTKICTHCKRKGHASQTCWLLHPELKPKLLHKTPSNIDAYSWTMYHQETSQETRSSISTDWIIYRQWMLSPHVSER
jgi:hypothetical protein